MSGAADEGTYLQADIAYHRSLVAATHNDHLIQLVEAFTGAPHLEQKLDPEAISEPHTVQKVMLINRFSVGFGIRCFLTRGCGGT